MSLIVEGTFLCRVIASAYRNIREEDWIFGLDNCEPVNADAVGTQEL